MKRICAFIMILVLSVSLFAACASDEADTKNPETTQSDASKSSSAATSDDNTKYGDAPTYQKDGKNYAKTESGTEVELSGENLEQLFKEYQDVQGKDKEKEKELLDKIQLILEAGTKNQ